MNDAILDPEVCIGEVCKKKQDDHWHTLDSLIFMYSEVSQDREMIPDSCGTDDYNTSQFSRT